MKNSSETALIESKISVIYMIRQYMNGLLRVDGSHVYKHENKEAGIKAFRCLGIESDQITDAELDKIEENLTKQFI